MRRSCGAAGPALLVACVALSTVMSTPGRATQQAQLRSVERDATPFHVKRQADQPAVDHGKDDAAPQRTGAPAQVERQAGGATESGSGDAVPVDTTGIWFHIEQRDAAAARREIDRLRRAYPDWTVPADIAAALVGLDAASAVASGDPARVVTLADAHPDLFTCTTPSNAWALAEAQVSLGRTRDAFQRYVTLARDCPSAATRLASAQKAWAIAETQTDKDTVLALLGDSDLAQADTVLQPARRAQREREIWDQVTAGRLDAARKAVAALQTSDPGWRPSRDLQAALTRLEVARQEAAHDPAAIVDLARRDPTLFGCAYPDNAWSLSEARGATAGAGARLDSYLELVRRCDGDVQVASLQKAWAGADAEARQRLLEDIDRNALTPAARGFLDIVGGGGGAGEGEVWARIEAGDVAGARSRLAELREGKADFKPSDDLLGALARLEVSEAQKRGSPADVVTAAERYPGQFGCGDIGNAWALAEARGRVEGPRARVRAYVDLARQCESRSVRVSSLQKALAGGGAGTERYVRQLMKGAPLPAPVETAMRRREIDRTVRRLAERRRAGDIGAAGLADRLADQAMAAHDANAARELGWWALSQDRPEEALDWFDRAIAWGGGESGREGRALALVRAGQLDHAERALADLEGGAARARVAPVLVSAWMELARARSEEGQEQGALVAARQAVALGCRQETVRVRRGAPESGESLCGDAYRTLAAQQYRMGDYAGVLGTAAAAERDGAKTRETREMAGWSMVSAGRPDDAIPVFERLYAEKPDRAAADGLVTAYADAGRLGALADRAPAGGPLAAAISAHTLTLARSRGMPLLAAAIADGSEPALAGVDSPTVGGAVYYRTKQGEPGQDRLRAWVGRAMASYTEGATRVDVEVDTARVDIGEPSPGDPVGSASTTWTRSPTDGATLVIPRVRVRHESPDLLLEGEIGTSPIGGAVSPVPTGSLSATWYGDPFILSGAAFSRSRWNSLLALSGMTDPTTGETWGRVSETGIEATGTLVISDRWAVSAGGLLSYLHGRNVDDNTRAAANLSASYDLAKSITDPAFEFLRVGPYYRFETYDENRSFFTLGHGGYFSPSQYHSLGAFVDWRTKEGKPWLLDGRASLGWTTQTEDAAPRFPLAPDGTSFAGSSSSGIAGDMQMRGEYLLDDNWRLGGLVRYSFAPDYQDATVGVRLTYSFDARSGLFGLDLPRGIPYGQ